MQYFYTVLLLNLRYFTQRFYPQILLHRDIVALRDDFFLTLAVTGIFSHTHTRARALQHRGSCAQKYFYTEMLSHGDGFTYPETLFSHTHTHSRTHTFNYTEVLLH